MPLAGTRGLLVERAEAKAATARREAQRKAEAAELIRVARSAVGRTSLGAVARGCRLTTDVLRNALRGKTTPQWSTLDKLRKWLPTLVLVALCACSGGERVPARGATIDTAVVNATGRLCAVDQSGVWHCYGVQGADRRPAPPLTPDTHPLSCARRPPPCAARD
jgi:hypothetical protein